MASCSANAWEQRSSRFSRRALSRWPSSEGTNAAFGSKIAGIGDLNGNGSGEIVAATGSGLRYQWNKDGVSIAGATNPSYTAVCLVNSYSPFASSVGDLATLSVSWPTSGTVVRATA